MKMILIFLTCADDKEASEITQKLLDEKLIACVKRISAESASFWKGEIEQEHEVMLIMETVEEKFEEIEEIVKEIHSYEMPGLMAIPVVRSSSGIDKWLEESLER